MSIKKSKCSCFDKEGNLVKVCTCDDLKIEDKMPCVAHEKPDCPSRFFSKKPADNCNIFRKLLKEKKSHLDCPYLKSLPEVKKTATKAQLLETLRHMVAEKENISFEKVTDKKVYSYVGKYLKD